MNFHLTDCFHGVDYFCKLRCRCTAFCLASVGRDFQLFVLLCSVSSNIQVATSELLLIVAKFYMNIMPLRPTEIHTVQFPRIGNGTLADIKTSKAEPTPAPLLKCSTLCNHRKHTGIELNRIQWNGI